jgi:hypothetical protein
MHGCHYCQLLLVHCSCIIKLNKVSFTLRHLAAYIVLKQNSCCDDSLLFITSQYALNKTVL